MSSIALKVNGRSHTLDVDPGHAAALRAERRPRAARPEVRLRSRPVRRVHRDRQRPAVRSCVTPVGSVAGPTSPRSKGSARSKAAPDSAGVHRRAGDAVRVLRQRRDHDGEGLRRSQSAARTIRRSSRRCRACCAAASRTAACCARSGATRAGARHEAPRPHARSPATTSRRRDFLAGSGALIVAFCASGPLERELEAQGHSARGPRTWTHNSSTRGSPIAADGGVTRLHRQVRAGAGHATQRRRSWWPRSCRVPISPRSAGDQCDTA